MFPIQRLLTPLTLGLALVGFEFDATSSAVE